MLTFSPKLTHSVSASTWFKRPSLKFVDICQRENNFCSRFRFFLLTLGKWSRRKSNCLRNPSGAWDWLIILEDCRWVINRYVIDNKPGKSKTYQLLERIRRYIEEPHVRGWVVSCDDTTGDNVRELLGKLAWVHRSPAEVIVEVSRKFCL